MKPSDVVEYFGGQTATARALGIRQGAVGHWIRNGEVPQLRQYQIERLTKKKLKAEEIENSA